MFDNFQEKNIFDGYFWGLLGTFLLSPFISLYFIVNGCLKGRKSAYFLIAVFLGLIAFMLAPVSDLASYGYMYYRSQNIGWEFFSSRYLGNGDFIMQAVLWCFAQIGIPFQWLCFFEAFIAFYLIIRLFFYTVEMSSKEYSSVEILIRFICYLMVFPFVLLVGGVRFGFAVIIAIYGIHLYIDRNSKIGCVLFFALASLIHFSLLYFLIIILISIHVKINRFPAIILLVFFFVCSYPFQKYLQAYFVSNELAGSGYLGDGLWGRRSGMTLGLNALVYHWGQRVCFLPLVYLFFKYYDKENKWFRVFNSLLFLFACCYSAFTLAQRITVLVSSISIFIFLIIESYAINFSVKEKYIFVICSLIVCSFDLWTHRMQLILSDYFRIIQPAIITFLQKYDEIWLFQHALDRFY